MRFKIKRIDILQNRKGTNLSSGIILPFIIMPAITFLCKYSINHGLSRFGLGGIETYIFLIMIIAYSAWIMVFYCINCYRLIKKTNGEKNKKIALIIGAWLAVLQLILSLLIAIFY